MESLLFDIWWFTHCLLGSYNPLWARYAWFISLILILCHFTWTQLWLPLKSNDPLESCNLKCCHQVWYCWQEWTKRRNLCNLGRGLEETRKFGIVLVHGFRGANRRPDTEVTGENWANRVVFKMCVQLDISQLRFIMRVIKIPITWDPSIYITIPTFHPPHSSSFLLNTHCFILQITIASLSPHKTHFRFTSFLS